VTGYVDQRRQLFRWVSACRDYARWDTPADRRRFISLSAPKLRHAYEDAYDAEYGRLRDERARAEQRVKQFSAAVDYMTSHPERYAKWQFLKADC
jgi:hypothetical protein